jgi:hypothetical protein
MLTRRLFDGAQLELGLLPIAADQAALAPALALIGIGSVHAPLPFEMLPGPVGLGPPIYLIVLLNADAVASPAALMTCEPPPFASLALQPPAALLLGLVDATIAAASPSLVLASPVEGVNRPAVMLDSTA